MKRILHLLLMAILLMPVYAAVSAEVSASKSTAKSVRTQVKTIRENLKNKKGSDALKGVETLRGDSAQKWKPSVLQYGVDAAKVLNDAENLKFYLKTSPDTVALFSTLYTLYTYALLTDSAERMMTVNPTLEKPYNIHYRKQNAELLSRFYWNLCSAPQYFSVKGNWSEAEKYSIMAIDVLQSPIFSTVKPEVDSTRLCGIATLYTSSCYNQKKYKDIDRYEALALKDSASLEYNLEKLVYAETEEGDTARAYYHLYMGHQHYPLNMFFFTRLVDYYLTTDNNYDVLQAANYSLEYVLSHAQQAVNDSLESMANRATGQEHIETPQDVESDSLSNARAALDDSVPRYSLPRTDIARFFEARALAYHNMDEPLKCIEEAENVLNWDPTHARADFYIGASYYLMAQKVEIPSHLYDPNYKKAKKERSRLYGLARPHLEKYRKLNPDEAVTWAPLLYEIYLYLNLGPEFEEISRYIKDTPTN